MQVHDRKFLETGGHTWPGSDFGRMVTHRPDACSLNERKAPESAPFTIQLALESLQLAVRADASLECLLRGCFGLQGCPSWHQATRRENELMKSW